MFALRILFLALCLMCTIIHDLSAGQHQARMNDGTDLCFTLSDSIAEPGAQTAMSMAVSNADSILAVEVTISYPADLLTALSVEKTDFTQSMLVISNLGIPGEIRMAMAGSVGLSGNGDLFRVIFAVIGPSGQTADVEIVKIEINEAGSGFGCARDGSVTIRRSVPPVADAGPDQVVEPGRSILLSGANSRGVNGGITGYSWVQAFGPTVELSDSESVQATFTAPEVDPSGISLVFRLTVTDENGLTSESSCIVSVTTSNTPPVADAGADQLTAPGEPASLDGSASNDSDGGIASWTWQQLSGPRVSLSDDHAAQPVFTAPEATGPEGDPLRFLLTVQDTGGLLSQDSCIVNVSSANSPPVSDAGEDQTVEGGYTVTLDGSASIDSDGSIASYSWSQRSGQPVALSDSAASRPTFTAPELADDPGGSSLVFQLSVTDSGGLQSDSSCRIELQASNHPPVMDGAPAGPRKGLTGKSYAFSASAHDSEGRPIQYRFDWGDGVVSSWDGPGRVSHRWSQAGSFCVKAQARDSAEAESAWSDCAQISILAPGSVTVTLQPEEALHGGAAWKLGNSPWYESGAKKEGLFPGQYSLRFKKLSGWQEPSQQTVTVSSGKTTTVTEKYIRQEGSLTILIAPQAAAKADARWRVDKGVWQKSGDTRAHLKAGKHDVEFKKIRGWTSPSDRRVTITAGKTLTVRAAYKKAKSTRTD